jgi:hypothetical protein
VQGLSKLMRILIFAETSDIVKQAAQFKPETCMVYDVLENGPSK